MMYARIVRIIAWLGVFTVPLLAAGYPMPYGIFALVPVLAAIDGVTPRRVAVWIGLTVLFELIYRVPVGILSLAVVAGAILDAGVRRGVRFDDTASRATISSRAAVRCVLWVVALLPVSAFFSWLLYGSSFSFSHVASLWLHASTGGVLAVGVFVLFIVLNRFTYRAPELRAW
jgi:hypothetical protein